jgi:hypothetical protein
VFVGKVMVNRMSTQTLGVVCVEMCRGGVEVVGDSDMCVQNGPSPCEYCIWKSENGIGCVQDVVH